MSIEFNTQREIFAPLDYDYLPFKAPTCSNAERKLLKFFAHMETPYRAAYPRKVVVSSWDNSERWEVSGVQKTKEYGEQTWLCLNGPIAGCIAIDTFIHSKWLIDQGLPAKQLGHCEAVLTRPLFAYPDNLNIYDALSVAGSVKNKQVGNKLSTILTTRPTEFYLDIMCAIFQEYYPTFFDEATFRANVLSYSGVVRPTQVERLWG